MYVIAFLAVYGHLRHNHVTTTHFLYYLLLWFFPFWMHWNCAQKLSLRMSFNCGLLIVFFQESWPTYLDGDRREIVWDSETLRAKNYMHSLYVQHFQNTYKYKRLLNFHQNFVVTSNFSLNIPYLHDVNKIKILLIWYDKW